MTEPEDFIPCALAADDLLERAGKDQLADVAERLALNIGWYRQGYGDVPQDSLLGVVRAGTLDAEGKRLPLHGIQNLVSALAEVMAVGENGEKDVRH